MSEITFYIVRHGKTVFNSQSKVQGWCDSPLTNEGIEVAEHLGKGLKDICFSDVYCSDLDRAKRTTEIILQHANQIKIPIVQLSEFRETCFGSYESDLIDKMWRDVAIHLQYQSTEAMNAALLNKKITYKEILDTIASLDKSATAENFEQVRLRIFSGLSKITEKHVRTKNKNVLIVSHGMAIIVLIKILGGENLIIDRIQNASVSKIKYKNNVFSVESVGDMKYIKSDREK